MARYHINAKGEPGKCKAFSDNCPYASANEHFSSPQAAQAAYEAAMGSSFGPVPQEEPKVSRKVEAAQSSSDPAVLFAVARQANRKIAKALAQNPHATPEALVEARSRTDLAWKEFTSLELHPAYPLGNMTNEGATAKLEAQSYEQNLAMMRSDEVGDTLADKAQYHGSALVEAALANPANRMTSTVIGRIAVEKPEYTVAAAKSGRFPTSEDIAGTNRYALSREVHQLHGYGYERGSVPAGTLVLAARHTPDNGIMREIHAKYRGTAHEMEVSKAILANPHANDATKAGVVRQLEAMQTEVQRLIEDAS